MVNKGTIVEEIWRERRKYSKFNISLQLKENKN
jgi:hypothetical protein